MDFLNYLTFFSICFLNNVLCEHITLIVDGQIQEGYSDSSLDGDKVLLLKDHGEILKLFLVTISFLKDK